MSAAEAVPRPWSRATAVASLRRGPFPLLYRPHSDWHLPYVSFLGRFPHGIPQHGRHLKPKTDDLRGVHSQNYHALWSGSRMYVLRLQRYLQTVIKRGRCHVLKQRDPIMGKGGIGHIH